MKAIIKKEIYNYFKTPLAVTFAVIYLLACGAAVFYIGNILEKNTADLSVFFKMNIWLYVFLIPSLSMRLFAEEEKTGTRELLYTLPVSPASVVTGKFLAALFFLFFTLLLTFPYVITVNVIGNPDNGVICAGYLSTLFLGAAFLAMGGFFSSLTGNQVIAFVLTVLFCLFFIVIGNEKVIVFLTGYFPNTMVKMVASLGFITHFSSVLRGVVYANDLIFFITFCGFWLYMTVLRMDVYSGGWTVIKVLLALITFISFNIFSYYSMSFIRFDMTEEALYTLSPETKKIIAEIKEPIIIKAYLSSNITEKSSKFADYGARILDMLDNYRNLSKGKLIVEVYDPKPFSAHEEDAIAYNLHSIEVDKMGNRGYLGLVAINSIGNTAKIPFFDIFDEDFMEYRLSKLLYDLSNSKRLKVGVLTGVEDIDGVGISPLSAPTTFKPRWAIMEELYANYDVKLLNPYKYELPENLDILIMINPKAILDKVLYGIDQFLMRGGKLLVFTDPYMESEDLYDRNPIMNTNINEVLAKWGISSPSDKVVLDPIYARDISIPKEGKKTYPGWLSLNDDMSVNRKSEVTGGLKLLNFASSGYLEVFPMDGVMSEILLKTSTRAGTVDVSRVVENGDNERLAPYYVDGGKELILAARLKGKFPSAFDEPPARIIGKKWTFDHFSEADENAEIIVVSDIDFLYEGMWGKRVYEKSMTPIINPFASNGDFVINAVDYLGGRSFLNHIRDKRMKTKRTFKMISDRTAALNAEHMKKEAVMRRALLKGREQMNAIIRNKSGSGFDLYSDLEKMTSLENAIYKIRREISDNRKYVSEKINSLLNYIRWINILAVPCVLLVVYSILMAIRNRKNS